MSLFSCTKIRILSSAGQSTRLITGRCRFDSRSIHLKENYEMRGGDVSETQSYILAEKDYMSGMKYKDIAKKYNVSINTVKSWKKRYGWERKKYAHKIEKVCTQNKEKKTVVADEVKQVVSNNELTDKQRLFCVLYTKCFNATKAAIKAGYSKDTAMEQGYQLLQKTSVKNEIQRLKQNRLNREMLNESDIFQKYMDIAFADITDFVEFGNEEIEIVDKNGQEHIIKVSNVNIKNDNEVDGTIISEVSKGKDGVKVKLADRMKALDWISNHMELATDEQKARIEQMKANTERLRRDNKPEDEEGVEIINDAPKEAGQNIGHRDTEVSSDIQQHEN